jgi:hypothetical protein
MAGYLLLERRFLQPHKSDGVRPNTVRLGFLDYLRELRDEPFHFPGGYRMLIGGLEDVLIAAGPNRDDVASYVHDLMASKANDLERMGGFVQFVFERRLSQAADFWFDLGLERVSLRRMFDSPHKQVDRVGNEYYVVGFNLT